MSAEAKEQAEDAALSEALADLGAQSGPLSQRVYNALRDAILELKLKPGSVLRKNVICEQLGVSRSPVAEAITLLAAEGLLEVVPQSVTRVAILSIAEIREESFLREAIEVAAVAKVAAERTEEQLALLTRNLRLQKLLVEDRDFRGFFEADEAFHAMLLSFTGFHKVAAISGQLSQHVRRARLLLLPEENRPQETLVEHEAVLDAIREGLPDRAANKMRFHLGQLISRIEPLEQSHPEYFNSRRSAS